MIEILTSPVFIIVVGIVLLLAIFKGFHITLKFKGLSIGFQPKHTKSSILDILRITEDSAIEIERTRSSILRCQMVFVEGILSSLNSSLGQYPNKDEFISLIKTKLRGNIQENGFENMSALEFSSYVGRQISIYRNLFKEQFPEDKFIDTPVFNDLIASIWNESRVIAENGHIRLTALKTELETRQNKVLRIL